jgi:DNA adenine methylase
MIFYLYTMETKPFLKWVGGKTQILSDVMKRFPRNMVNYYEPFLGGGSVLLALLTEQQKGTIQVSGTVYASDINSNLIGLYKNVQSDPDTFIREMKHLMDDFAECKGTVVNRNASTMEEARTSQESYYFWIRNQFNAFSKEERASMRGSAMLLFLNKTCFRGLYREGPHGFNVPFGNYKNPSIMNAEHIQHVSRLIQNVVFTYASFTEVLQDVSEHDFVYMDPPYVQENKTSFVAYTADGFKIEKNHADLFRLCDDMNKKKVRFLLSNAEVPFVTNWCVKYTTDVISCRRSIHSKKPDSRTNEVLITNSYIVS